MPGQIIRIGKDDRRRKVYTDTSCGTERRYYRFHVIWSYGVGQEVKGSELLGRDEKPECLGFLIKASPVGTPVVASLIMIMKRASLVVFEEQPILYFRHKDILGFCIQIGGTFLLGRIWARVSKFQLIN